MKRWISAILATICVFSLSATAFAAEGEDLEAPQVRIITESGNGNELQKTDGYVDAQITITDTDGSSMTDNVSLKVRGNSTGLPWVEKKSFNFKYAKKKDVLHMGKAKKWSLLANLFDPTLIRNYIGLETARGLGLAYTSEQRIAEVWLDDVYKGFYTLTEPVGDGENRVDIDTDDDEFIIEYEATRKEVGVTYLNIDGLRFSFKEPDEPVDRQVSFVNEVLTDIVATMKTGSKEEIGQKIDIESFVKFYLLNEYLKTVDFGFSSVFFYYKDGMLYAGPPWDFDLSTGNSNPLYSENAARAAVPDGLYANEKNFYSILCSYDWFNYEAKRTYEEYGAFFENVYAQDGMIDSVLAEYRGVIDRNYSDAGWRVSRHWAVVQMKPLSTYDSNLAYLKNWLYERDLWLCECFASQEYYLKGDSDGDEVLTILDATNIQRILAGIITDYDEMTMIRSRTSDDILSILDATYIQKCLAMLGNPHRLNEMTLLKR